MAERAANLGGEEKGPRDS